jgi:Spy/CpxP family protein refolding chaperone
MSLTAIASRGSAVRSPIIVKLGFFLILGTGLVSTALAQSSPGGYGPGNPGMRAGGGYGRHMGSHGGGHQMLSSETIEGPAAPDVMRDSVGLNGTPLQTYTRRYQNYMANTKVTRDSLRSEVQTMRAAFESGDRSAARDQRDRMDQQSKELAKQDETFDNGLKDILSKDQQKQYKKWKDNRDKAERAQWSKR